MLNVAAETRLASAVGTRAQTPEPARPARAKKQGAQGASRRSHSVATAAPSALSGGGSSKAATTSRERERAPHSRRARCVASASASASASPSPAPAGLKRPQASSPTVARIAIDGFLFCTVQVVVVVFRCLRSVSIVTSDCCTPRYLLAALRREA